MRIKLLLDKLRHVSVRVVTCSISTLASGSSCSSLSSTCCIQTLSIVLLALLYLELCEYKLNWWSRSPCKVAQLLSSGGLAIIKTSGATLLVSENLSPSQHGRIVSWLLLTSNSCMDSYCQVVEGRLMSKLLERFSLVTLGRQKRKSCNLFSLLCDRLISVSEGQKSMSLPTKGSLLNILICYHQHWVFVEMEEAIDIMEDQLTYYEIMTKREVYDTSEDHQ